MDIVEEPAKSHVIIIQALFYVTIAIKLEAAVSRRKTPPSSGWTILHQILNVELAALADCAIWVRWSEKNVPIWPGQDCQIVRGCLSLGPAGHHDVAPCAHLVSYASKLTYNTPKIAHNFNSMTFMSFKFLFGKYCVQACACGLLCVHLKSYPQHKMHCNTVSIPHWWRLLLEHWFAVHRGSTLLKMSFLKVKAQKYFHH